MPPCSQSSHTRFSVLRPTPNLNQRSPNIVDISVKTPSPQISEKLSRYPIRRYDILAQGNSRSGEKALESAPTCPLKPAKPRSTQRVRDPNHSAPKALFFIRGWCLPRGEAARGAPESETVRGLSMLSLSWLCVSLLGAARAEYEEGGAVTLYANKVASLASQPWRAVRCSAWRSLSAGRPLCQPLRGVRILQPALLRARRDRDQTRGPRAAAQGRPADQDQI